MVAKFLFTASLALLLSSVPSATAYTVRPEEPSATPVYTTDMVTSLIAAQESDYSGHLTNAFKTINGTLLYPNGKNHSQTFDVQLGEFEVGNSHMAINQLNYVIHNITSLETLTFSKIAARNVLSQVTGKTPTASEGQLLESVLDLSLMINEDEGHRFGYGITVSELTSGSIGQGLFEFELIPQDVGFHGEAKAKFSVNKDSKEGDDSAFCLTSIEIDHTKFSMETSFTVRMGQDKFGFLSEEQNLILTSHPKLVPFWKQVDELTQSKVVEAVIKAVEAALQEAILDQPCMNTHSPTKSPSASPTKSPSLSPTTSPSISPSKSPSMSPTVSPSKSPSKAPSRSPTHSPTKAPSSSPTKGPTASPTERPILTFNTNNQHYKTARSVQLQKISKKEGTFAAYFPDRYAAVDIDLGDLFVFEPDNRQGATLSFNKASSESSRSGIHYTTQLSSSSDVPHLVGQTTSYDRNRIAQSMRNPFPGPLMYRAVRASAKDGSNHKEAALTAHVYLAFGLKAEEFAALVQCLNRETRGSNCLTNISEVGVISGSGYRAPVYTVLAVLAALSVFLRL